jgi:hypothetical protein
MCWPLSSAGREVDAARAAAELFGGFEYGDIDPCLRQFDRRRQAGPAAADDRCFSTLDPGPPGDPQLADRRQRSALVEDLAAVALDFVEQVR